MTSKTVDELGVGDRFIIAPGVVMIVDAIVKETPKTRTFREVYAECPFAPSRVGTRWPSNGRRRGTIFEVPRD